MADALAILELSGVATGYYVLDKMLKHSPVEIIEANLIEPGVYLILYTGGVAEVQEAHQAVIQSRKDGIRAELILPFAHPSILSGLKGAELKYSAEQYDCLGVIETNSVSSSLMGADQAIKNTDVSLVGIRIAGGLGGKAYYVMCGSQHDVEVALDISQAEVEKVGGIHRRELIPRPHQDMIEWLLRPAPFSIKR